MTTWATKHGNRFVCAFGASLLAQSVKQNLPAMQETQVQFLGREDPLEKEMATHPVFLPGESHGQKSLVGYSLWGCKRGGHNLVAKQQKICG